MASYLQIMISIVVILAMAAVPSSRSHREEEDWRRSEDSSDNIEQYLRDLCSETDRSDVCWDILKSVVHRFDDSDDGDIAKGVIDMAVQRSKEIEQQLKQWHKESNDDKLKKKYHSCSKTYKDIAKSLQKTKKKLDSDDDDRRRISDKIDEAEKKLDKCFKEFDSDSFDPAHVEDRNNELQIYLDIVRVAADRFQDLYDDDDDDDDRH